MISVPRQFWLVRKERMVVEENVEVELKVAPPVKICAAVHIPDDA